MTTLKDIKLAKENIKNIVKVTPFIYSDLLSDKANVYLKKENLQLTGAYKIRGAYNKVSSLSLQEKKNGVIAASAGNHAQGVAYASLKLGINSTIVMPEATPLSKVNGTKKLGANIILHGSNYDEAYEYAKTLAKEQGLTFIHPFEDDLVKAGQGTVALEILEDCKDVDTVIVPIGGGGLISGMSIALKSINPNIRVIGVTARGASATRDSYKLGKVVNSKAVKTIADGIAVRCASKINLETLIKYVDDIVEVDDEEIASAVLFLLESQKLVVEGGGAVGVAALMHDKFKYKKNENIAIVLSGGNIDVNMLSIIIEKGLSKSYRKMQLLITLIDKPGSLMYLTELLNTVGANITQIGYDRVSTRLSYGDANVSMSLETKGKDHQEEIRKIIKENGYSFEEKY
ncbi:MAG: Threonine dehydratase (EC [uncultured Campylobacterales bacterium]|uniref:Threonine dehydratase (EC) n=1 Tax=uncultured Campylobacterales bacterium TaxID=352960 RepID=A0A6S6SCB5_9BACT|nr:MAG: Threonine dehydratase (EC [uncultured Campylobacterales bacterium]